MTSATIPISPTPKRPSWHERTWRALQKLQFVVYTILICLLMAIGFFWQRVFVFIEPGHRGVMYRSLYGGTVIDRTWSEGLHVIPPWDRMIPYEVRLIQQTIDFTVLSDEGLELGVQVVVRYRPYQEMLGHLHRDIGPDYFNRLVRPDVEAHIRRTFGGRPAHEIYATMHDVLQEVGQIPVENRVEETSGLGLKSRPYLNQQTPMITGIKLPKIVETAIVEKYHQEQLMLAYTYKLDREEKEAARKRTEASGIRDFNTIAGRVSPDMLRWRSIDAALELSRSANSKVIILGGGGASALPISLQLNTDNPEGPTPEQPSHTPSPRKNAEKPAPLEGMLGNTRSEAPQPVPPKSTLLSSAKPSPAALPVPADSTIPATR